MGIKILKLGILYLPEYLSRQKHIYIKDGGISVTRNSLDDLFISQYLFTKYIEFLLERLNQEHEYIKHEYLGLNRSMLSEKSNQYICNQEYFHCKSTVIYLNFLTEIQKKVSDFYEKNQRPLSLYSIEAYHENIKKHEEKISQIISDLFKY